MGIFFIFFLVALVNEAKRGGLERKGETLFPVHTRSKELKQLPNSAHQTQLAVSSILRHRFQFSVCVTLGLAH
jgi:hypothetical protein